MDQQQQASVARGLIEGDPRAWQSFYELYCEQVWRLAARMVGSDSHAVADVVQEVFVAAAESARCFDSQRGTLRSWVLGITRRQVLMMWRRQVRWPRTGFDAEANVSWETALLDSNDLAADCLERRELASHVRTALSELDESYAELLIAKYVTEETMQEIADSRRETVASVHSKLARARRSFRQKVRHSTIGNSLKSREQ